MCFCISLIHLLCEFAVMACQAVANIVKSSLGPVGLDKVASLPPFLVYEHLYLFCAHTP